MTARTMRPHERAREAGAEVIVHPQNRGKGEAIKTGLRHWLDRGLQFVVILDADGQHLPEEIERFVAAASFAGRAKTVRRHPHERCRATCRSFGAWSIAT